MQPIKANAPIANEPPATARPKIHANADVIVTKRVISGQKISVIPVFLTTVHCSLVSIIFL